MQDFSKNYTCLVPEEVQSLHWSQTQATLYPVVIYRKESDNIIEKQLVYISDDLHHNEFNDGCSAQYKSIWVFWLFAKQTVKTDCVFFESSHGKGPSDGVGGVRKTMCAAAVSGNKVLLQDAKEMYTYLHLNHTIAKCPFQNGHISFRKYFYISKEEINQYGSSLEKLP